MIDFVRLMLVFMIVFGFDINWAILTALLFLQIKLLFYLQVFEGTRYMFMMIRRVLTDMVSFTVILVAIIFSYGLMQAALAHLANDERVD